MKISGSIGPTLIGKQIVLGVTGSIAAYKAVALLRTLLREGATVHVVMTMPHRGRPRQAAWAATRFIQAQLFGVAPTDLLTMAAATLGIVAPGA